MNCSLRKLYKMEIVYDYSSNQIYLFLSLKNLFPTVQLDHLLLSHFSTVKGSKHFLIFCSFKSFSFPLKLENHIWKLGYYRSLQNTWNISKVLKTFIATYMICLFCSLGKLMEGGGFFQLVENGSSQNEFLTS